MSSVTRAVNAMELLAREGPAAVASLIERGMEFDRDTGGKIDLAREGGHRCRRILHAGGDKTGRALTRFLLRLVGMTPSITIERGAFAWDLIVRDANVVGLLAYHEDDGWIVHRAPQIVIASGGSGQLYRRTTNPSEATGDAIALAARAGATLKDLEFVQFHPTALATGRDRINRRAPLLTEALRGEGAVLVDETGARIMAGNHPMGDLAPRDIVARAVEMRIHVSRARAAASHPTSQSDHSGGGRMWYGRARGPASVPHTMPAPARGPRAIRALASR